MRTIVDLPAADVKTLDVIAKRLNVSRAEMIRRCVRLYLDDFGKSHTIFTHDIFGTYDDIFKGDAVEIQRALREGWTNNEDYARIIHQRQTREIAEIYSKPPKPDGDDM